MQRYRSRVSRTGASTVWDGRWLPMRRKLSLGEAPTRRASVKRWRISGSARQPFRDTAPRDGGSAGRASPIFWARWKGTHGVYPFHREHSHQVPPRTFTSRLGDIKSGFANCGAILVARITRQSAKQSCRFIPRQRAARRSDGQSRRRFRFRSSGWRSSQA